MINYAVTFQSLTTGRVSVDLFTELFPAAARKAFNECYRHDSYNILSVAEVPDIKAVS